MKEVSDRELIVFSAARRLSVGARAAYLDEACAGDAALRQRVEELLRAGDEAGAFLQSPAAAPSGPGGTLRLELTPTEKPGDRIGRYKLLQQIGEGGCGVVYMAEQTEPVHRRVALKVIKLGMDTKQVIARFEAERQAVALMDHPNIAKVLDVGATDAGRPYFVMELVRGIKITDYCDQNNLSTRERLDLFIQVCQAIQHAHQKGVIHHDIKPSNILVTVNDGVAVPKVIDFGIARATQGRLTDKTLFTAFEQFIGTPAYMSPEQAVMTSLDIDTRSDIYSLGVLLYELLTGKTPFDAKALLQSGLDAMRRTIREVEPPKPSARLSTMLDAERATTASQRQTEPPKLIHLLKGDLDWIVMKCLEKDRGRRYETANAVAIDLRRHLSCEPVLACPPSRLYEFQKTVRRHKFGFAATAALITVLAIGLLVSWSEMMRARRAEREQVRLRQQAQTEAAKSQQVAQFLKDMLNGVGPSVALGRDTTMLREILDKTAERVGKDLKDQPDVEANLWNTLGDVYLDLGEYQKAEAMQRAALAIRMKLFGHEHLYVAESLWGLADVLRRKGNFAESETLLRDSLTIFRKLRGDENRDVAAELSMLADVLRYEGKLDEAEPMQRQALSLNRKLFGNEDVMVGISLNNLGLVLQMQGKFFEAETMFREALAIYKKALGDEDPEIAVTLDNLAGVLLDQGRLTEAEATCRETLAMRRKLLGNDHPKVAESLNKLAWVLQMQGKPAEAETMVREALAMLRKSQGRETPEAADLLGNLAYLLQSEGKLNEAETMQREALMIQRRLQGDEGLRVGSSLAQLTAILLDENKFSDAEPPARECLTIREKMIPDLWRTFNSRSLLGGSLLGQKKYAEAEPLLLSGYEGMKQREDRIPADGKFQLKKALQRLVQLYEATDRPDQAAQWNQKLAEFDKAETGKKADAPQS